MTFMPVRGQIHQLRLQSVPAEVRARYDRARDDSLKDAAGRGPISEELKLDIEAAALLTAETGQALPHDLRDLSAARHAAMVRERVESLQVRDDAQAAHTAQGATVDALPRLSTLRDRLAAPRAEQAWRIAGLWPVGGRVNLAAAPKTGKTTMVTNIVRALVDGGEFLGEYAAETVPVGAGPSVVIFDFEMTERQLLDWYEAQDIGAAERVEVVPLRGHAGAFDFLNPTIRAALVDRYAGAHTYILDPAGPVLSSLGLEENSNTDVQRFLTTWDQFVLELGGQESLIVVHAGHNGERARGASAFIGSGDAVWTLTKDGDDPDAPRSLAAVGRDVAVPARVLHFDRDRLGLSLTGMTRAEAKAQQKIQAAVPYVLAVLEACGPGTSRTLWERTSDQRAEEAWKVTRQAFLQAFDEAVRQGAVGHRPGPTGGREYFLIGVHNR